MRQVIAGIIAPVLTAGCMCTFIPRSAGSSCANVVIAERTATGHEADMPVTLCGMSRGNWTCTVVKGILRANAKLVCTENKS